jgi:TetR/AcrR family transcriptional regulator of autoinduction and epiphytic fitness
VRSELAGIPSVGKAGVPPNSQGDTQNCTGCAPSVHCALVTTAASASARATDGRTARSAKTRDAIADALLDLLTEGNLRPTAREIATQAGVSLRSVYVHFDDLEDLYCVAAARHFERVAPMLEPVQSSGSMRDRVTALVDRRVRLYDKIGAVGRATERQAPFSPTLSRIVRQAYARSRRELERAFAIELEARAPEERARVLAIVDVLVHPRTWETIRDVHGFELDAAKRVIADAIVDQLDGDT